MIFAHEFKVKPSKKENKRIKKSYLSAPATPDKVVFYDKKFSNLFGNRFSYEPFVTKKNNEQDNNKKDHVLIKEKKYNK